MQLIPAIDIRKGKCVRLSQGDPERQINYPRSPVETAEQFVRDGAKKIHIVDLDGAIEGASENQEVIKEIVESVPVRIELGGGIRSLKHIERWLSLGISQVILGTLAIKNPETVKEAIDEFGHQRIILGVDTKGDKVATHGWQTVTDSPATGFARRMEEMGIRRFIFTAIETDGMMAGPAFGTLKEFAQDLDAKVTASGGIRNIDDILALRNFEEYGIDSVIAGKAIYEGKLDVSRATALLAKGEE